MRLHVFPFADAINIFSALYRIFYKKINKGRSKHNINWLHTNELCIILVLY